MTDNLLKATMALVEASYMRDFIDGEGGSKFEPRVFDAVSNVLDLLANHPNPAVQRWALELRAREEQELARQGAREEAS